MNVLIDTSIIVKIARKDRKTIETIQDIEANHALLISTITVMEILTGSNLHQAPDQAVRKAKQLLARMKSIDVDDLIAGKAGEINAFLIRTGQIIELPDVIIAATCMVKQLDAILTYNTEHFHRIPAVKDLACEPGDWLALTGSR